MYSTSYPPDVKNLILAFFFSIFHFHITVKFLISRQGSACCFFNVIPEAAVLKQLPLSFLEQVVYRVLKVAGKLSLSREGFPSPAPDYPAVSPLSTHLLSPQSGLHFLLASNPGCA